MVIAQDAAIRSGAAGSAYRSKAPQQTPDKPGQFVRYDRYDRGRKSGNRHGKRKRLAKESAMAKMKAQAAKLALMMDVEPERTKMTPFSRQ
jgi:hypothetical protein